jgi:hypothetical protein
VEKFFVPFPWALRRAGTEGLRCRARRKRRIVHRASLTRFLIFCERLLFEPLAFGRAVPAADAPQALSSRIVASPLQPKGMQARSLPHQSVRGDRAHKRVRSPSSWPLSHCPK